jgi:membrane associated rhomboid family serine protease
MIPLRDENPSRTVPVVSRGLIVINCVAFLYEMLLGRGLKEFVFEWGLVPARLTQAIQLGEEPLTVPALTLLTSTFLHGGWLHLLGNMWYLWIFGDNIEDRLGKLRFLTFYILAGIAAGLIHYFSNPTSRLPTVGASGAIAAVLGAYAITFPRARVITLVPIFLFFQVMALPAMLMLGLWFVYQFLLGALSLAWGTGTGGGTAWWAHIGGFAFGALAIKIFGLRRRSEAWAE